MTLTYQRLRAPAENDGVLQIPAISDAAQTLGDNRRILDEHDFQLFGQPINAVRRSARSEMLRLAAEYSSRYRDADLDEKIDQVVLSGHQPTLFHPGVWLKNFALNHLAKSTGSVAVNLVVDNDLAGLPGIRVPDLTAEEAITELIRFDSRNYAGPFETEPLHDRPFFDSFAKRVRETSQSVLGEALVNRLWPFVIESASRLNRPSMAIAAGRHRLEQDFGLKHLELPLSQICESRSFALFAAEIISRAKDFRDRYNDTLQQYRKVNRIRSRSHPVPALQLVDDWIEVPFWIWQTEAKNRHPLFVQENGGSLVFSNRREIEFRLEKKNLADQIHDLSNHGVRLRSRALTTTMFARLVLADCFIHGIGGAKYDQLTDQIVRVFFQAASPAFFTVTGTYQLSIEHARVTRQDVQRLVNQKRRMLYHGERYVGDASDAQALKDEKRQLIENIPGKGSRKGWHDQMASVNHQLQRALQQDLARLELDLIDARAQNRSHDRLGSREFSFCLFDESLPGRLVKSLNAVV